MDAPIEGREPIWSLEAEISVIGAALIDTDAVIETLAGLNASDFFRNAHREIFRGIRAIFERGEAVDIVTLAEELKSRKKLEEAGGHRYLADLLDAVPTAANVEYHIGIVQDRAKLRRLVEACSQSIQDAFDSNGDGPKPVIERAERRIFSILDERDVGEGFTSPKRALWKAMELIEEEESATGGVTGISTGFPGLDQATSGLQPGDLTLLAGRPSHGKSAMAWGMVAHAADQGHTCAIASLEMAEDQLVKRALAAKAGVDLMDIRRGQLSTDDWKEITGAASWFNELPIRIDDATGGSIDELRAKVRRLAVAEDVSLVMVDYLQLMDGVGETRTNQIGSVSRGLKRLAREFDCHVLALSQLSRGVENRKPPRPVLSDLRDSGNLEQDADNVLMLWRPELYFTDRTSDKHRAKWTDRGELLLRKQRNGPLGSWLLSWDKRTTSFRELAREHEERKAEEVESEEPEFVQGSAL